MMIKAILSSRQLAGGFGLLLTLVLVLAMVFPVVADTPPPTPHQIYGNADICNTSVPEGTDIFAMIGGVVYATTQVDAEGKYGYDPLFYVPADDPNTPEKDGGDDLDTVELWMLGRKAGEFTFKSGNIDRVDLQITEVYLTVSYGGAGGGVTNPAAGVHTYTCDDVVGIEAFPDINSRFDHWEGDLTGDTNPESITMDGDKEVTAVFEPNCQLIVSANPPEGGTATGSIGYCDEDAPITATANTCWYFTGWTGTAVDYGKVANPAAASTTVNVDGNYTAVANFSKYQYTLTTAVSPDGSYGSVSGADTYDCGTLVDVEATPASACYYFDHWEGDLTGDTNPTQIEMDEDKDITAVFGRYQYSVSTAVDPVGVGTVTLAPSGGTYDCCTTINVCAVATDACYEFSHWSGDLTGTSSTKSLHIDGDKSVTAHFTIKQYVLTVEADPITGGTVTGSGTYNCGVSAPITATANEGWEFVEWTGSGIADPAATSTTVAMDSTKTVTAHFQEEGTTCSLTVSSTAGGYVLPDSSEWPDFSDCLQSIVLTAVPLPCYEFAGWTGDVFAIDSGDESTAMITVAVTGQIDLMAHFSYMEDADILMDITLHEDWDTFSTPIALHPCTDQWGEIKLANDLDVAIIYGFNAVTGYWFNALDTDVVEPLDGYYLKMNEAGSIHIIPDPDPTPPPVKSLSEGVNLIGLASLTDRDIASALISVYLVNGNYIGYTQVMSPPVNYPYNYDYVRDDTLSIPYMRVGDAVWVSMVNGGSLTGFSSTPMAP